MKKAILILMLIVVAFSVTSAIDIRSYFTQKQIIALKTIGIEKPDISKVICDTKYCYFNVDAVRNIEITKNVTKELSYTYNKTVSVLSKQIKFKAYDIENNYYSDEQLRNIRLKLVKKELVKIADTAIERYERAKETRLTSDSLDI